MAADNDSEANFRVTTSRRAPETVALAVSGELDMAAAPSLAAALDDAIKASSGKLELDLRECSFIDSRGLQVIIEAGGSLAAQGRSLVLKSPQPHVRRLFDTAGIDQIEGLEVVTGSPEPNGDS